MGSIYNTSLNTMAKTRTLTATFPNGKQVVRTTGRDYTHVVVFLDERGWKQPIDFKWCGRPDLMQKTLGKTARYEKVYNYKNVYTEVAEIINDPWAA